MVQQNGHFFTGHRCTCSLPNNIPRISEGYYFPDMHRKQKFQLRPIYLALEDLGTQFLPDLHSFSDADITGTVA